MKKFATLLLGTFLSLGLIVLLGALAPAAAQTDQKEVKCGTDQVPVGVAINGNNCIDKGTTAETNVIFVWLSSIIKFMTLGVGLAATGGAVYGSYLYLTAQGKPAQTHKGIITIINSLIGIALYALAFAIINYLVPGGVLK